MNVQLQEESWSISCDLLKDWMSPELWIKYFTAIQNTVTQSSNSDGGDVTDKTTTTVDNADKPPAISNDEQNQKAESNLNAMPAVMILIKLYIQ